MKRPNHTIFLIPLFLFGALFSCGKKGNDKPATVVPSVKVTDASQARSTVETTLYFQVSLSKATTVPVSVSYSFRDETAVASKDYVATPGTVTIPANKISAEIKVVIKGDPANTRQDNLHFKIELSNPVNGTLGSSSATGTIITENGTSLATDNTGYTTPVSYPGYHLVWSDEFDGTGVDGNSWNFETGNGSGGWGNNELEYYTSSPKNVFVSNGNLIIEARKESISGFNYSSARMTTQNKKQFTFGRVDIRAKLPVAKGMWPALWMLGSNISSVGWPACGEIDIMELVGSGPRNVYSTIHWGTSPATHALKNAGYTLASGDFSQQFHVFSMVWIKDKIDFMVDDQLFLSTTRADVGAANYPFNDPQFFIFNVAVGGDWPGPPDGNTAFPQRMFVDYVRVFQSE